jgi:hypothetical protein
VKLWNLYGYGAVGKEDLACHRCACQIAKEKKQKYYSFEEIGDYTRAIPTEDNNGYHAFIQVPAERVTWWNNLPL